MSNVLNAVMSPRASMDANEPPKPAIHDVDYIHTREVVIKVATVIGFYLFASIYYANVEGWSVQDCIYFLTVTISTVGYGDYHPTTDNSRMFTIFVIIIGLVFIFSILSDFANFVLKLAEEQAAKIAKQKEPVLNDPYKYWKKRASPLLMVLTLLFVCSITLWQLEEWTYIQALYFSVVTVTTIGYGDLALDQDDSKIFMIMFIPISVCVVAAALGSIASITIEMEADRKKLENLNRKLDFNMIREMDKDGDGVDKLEFLIAMLVQNNICNQEDDIDPWLKRFDELDKDGSGRLDKDDIAIMEREENERIARLQEMQLPGSRQVSTASASGAMTHHASQDNPLGGNMQIDV